MRKARKRECGVAEKTFIQSVFIDPPIAIARLGGSTAPLDAYEWSQSANPRTSDGETVITPTWSLNVLPDDTVEPIMPAEIKLRDGNQIRPVCPFFEVWAMVSANPGDPMATWEERPLTTQLLQQNALTESAVRLRVNAQNRKAARRADDSRLAFGTFPTVSIRGDHHAVVRLEGVSPPSVPANQRMIPDGRPIPLGSVQIMRPAAQPATPTAWSEAGIRRDVIRFRFTPARGEFYGPRAASQTTPPAVMPVSHDYLRGGAGWLRSPRDARPRPLRVVVPEDTIDETQNGSLGVVDDTCEARLEITLTLPGRSALSAHANLFVAPPDFGPDRRPFLSVADELNDRIGDPASRDVALSAEQRDAWIEDLFERIFETVMLLNVDFYRLENGIPRLPPSRLQPPPGIVGDGLPDVLRAMGARDAMRNQKLGPLSPPGDGRLLPLSARAHERHRDLSDIDFLKDFVGQTRGRLRALIRGPFEIESDEVGSDSQTMRMPPFMRNSNANPLTLSAWQYELLMAWVGQVETAAVALEALAAPAPMPAFAARRRASVLERVRRRGPQ
jgi:hypothetical protein